MKDLKTEVTIYDIKGNINVYFYQNNTMPALMVEDDEGNLIEDLTTNHRLFVENAISIRSDNPDNIKLLKECGWIEDQEIRRVRSGFIDLIYIPLTDKALEVVRKRALFFEEDYPQNV